MKPSERLLKIRGDIDTILTKREEGTADYPRQVPRVDTAFQRAQDRAGAGNVPNGDPDLGDDELDRIVNDPEMAEERRNQERVKRQAEKDAWDIDVIVGRMMKDAATLRTIVDRQAEVIHESKLPVNVLPGCRSCARRENYNGHTIGGHHADIYEKSVGSGLCRDCWEFESAMDAIPPIMWCHLLHTQKKRAANRWLADNYPQLVAVAQKRAKIRKPKRPRLCGHPTGKDGEPCARRLMHQGECLPASELGRLASDSVAS